MNYRILIIAIISILLVESCNSSSKNKALIKSNSRDSIVTIDGRGKLNEDSVLYYYNEAKLLSKETEAFKVLKVLDKSKLGTLDFYASDIKNVFSKTRIKEISSCLLYYVKYLFISCEEYHKDIFNDNFDNMPESAQRASVQSEMNSRENKLKKAKNILDAVLSLDTDDKAQALLLYGDVLYNLYEKENAEKAYSEYYNIMKEEGMEKEVPSYVVNPDERKMIDDE